MRRRRASPTTAARARAGAARNVEDKSLKDRKNDGSHLPPRGGKSSGDINDVFPHKVCINLARRADRWEQMRLKFARHRIRGVRRISAADGQALSVPPGWPNTPGAYGCLLSHLRVVRQARELGLPAVLIFEDDVVFDDRLQDNFRTYIAQVPRDWDMLHFGALHLNEPVLISENVHRIRRAYSTYAYALKRTVFDAFIELNSKAAAAVDINNHALQSEHACYCFTPHLAWVEDDSSDVQERQKNHWYLQESLVIHGGGMDQLLGQTSLVIAYENAAGNDGVERNLLLLTRFYRERLPGIGVVVVEQGARTTVNPAALPEGCLYFLLRDEGPLDKGRCFNAGTRLANPEHTLMIFSDGDIFVEEWDIRGNLRMCQRYECTTGFGQLINLTSDDTTKLHLHEAMLTPWFDAKKYSTSEKSDAFSNYCVFDRRSLHAAGGWQEGRAHEKGPALASGAERGLRVFQPPNRALRLRHD